MNASHLKAFTLLELLVALALVSLVLLTGASVFRILTGFQIRYQEQVDATYDRALLRQSLNQDIAASWSLDRQADSLFLYDRQEEVKFRYYLQDSLILRLSSQTVDTFSFRGQFQLSQDRGMCILTDTAQGESYSFRLPRRSQVW